MIIEWTLVTIELVYIYLAGLAPTLDCLLSQSHDRAMHVQALWRLKKKVDHTLSNVHWGGSGIMGLLTRALV